jgi:hypothetical protein
MEYQTKHSSASRNFRNDVLRGVELTIIDRAILEARGIDTEALEQRIRQSKEIRPS